MCVYIYTARIKYKPIFSDEISSIKRRSVYRIRTSLYIYVHIYQDCVWTNQYIMIEGLVIYFVLCF